LKLQEHLISINKENLADAAAELLKMQKNSFQQCKYGYESLSNVQTKDFDIHGSRIYIQYNAGRITSTSARVDETSIKERECFLCNLPQDQKGIQYNDYIILCNPYPIFPEHFTISSSRHTPQEILNSFPDFLKITKELADKYIVFYNGAECGASAPDHLHFQAGTKDFLPLIRNLNVHKEKFSSLMYSGNETAVYSLNDYLRRMIIIEGGSAEEIVKEFNRLYSIIQKIFLTGNEPMMNLAGTYENNLWNIIIFLREKHRPEVFYEEGEKNIMVSPAAVDLSGVIITPLQKDFEKITKNDVEKIFNEVIIEEERFNKILELIK
jgi:hypothetical protein